MVMTEEALFPHRQGRKKHLRAKLLAKIMLGNWCIWFNKLATRWLDVWMEAHLTFKEYHNQCMEKARAAEASLQTLTKTYRVAPDDVRAV
jgi:hypothetical protein